LLVGLQGCAAVYTPAAGEATSTVRNVGFGELRMCRFGKIYQLPQAKGDPKAVIVPAGQRITLSAHLRSDGYQVSYHCVPAVSFAPEDGLLYVANSALSGDGRCGIEVVRDDKASLTGVSIEPSVGPPQCQVAR
jgi:hypothetical protein